MRNDARAHGVLSEPSVSLHIHAHDRKGDRREEIGERKGREGRVETSHHVVAYVTRGARGSAPVVAPSPVTTPDAMMSLTAIEHLDFEHEVPCEDLTATGESADYLAELAEWVAAECPELRRRMMICRKHFEEINAVGALHAPWLPLPARIVQVLR